jgi:hypothetical protein
MKPSVRSLTENLEIARKLAADALYFYEVQIHLQAQLTREQYPDAFNRFEPYWTIASTSVAISLISSLYKLGEKGDKVTIPVLLESALSEGIINECEKNAFMVEFEKYKATRDGVSLVRNNHVGHLSKFLESEDAYRSANLTGKELEALAKGYFSILNGLASKTTLPSIETDVDRRLKNVHDSMSALFSKLNE